jgi:hypothetical protein
MSRNPGSPTHSMSYGATLDPYRPWTLWSPLRRFGHFWKRYGAAGAFAAGRPNKDATIVQTNAASCRLTCLPILTKLSRGGG